MGDRIDLRSLPDAPGPEPRIRFDEVPYLADDATLDRLVRRLLQSFDLCDGKEGVGPLTASYFGIVMLAAAQQITALRAALQDGGER